MIPVTKMKIKNFLVKKTKKAIGKFKVGTPKSFWIDGFVCLRSEAYSFKCGDDVKNKLKRISKSQTKHFTSENYKSCLDGGENQRECNNYLIRSTCHEKYP